MSKIFFIIKFLRHARISLVVGLILREVARRIYSNYFFYCLRFDVSKNIVIPNVPFSLKIKKLHVNDLFKIVNFYKGITSDELKYLIEIIRLFHAGIPTCYAAYSDNGEPYALCWLISYNDKMKIKKYFKGNILDLKYDEVLCESIYTHHNYRGFDLMAFLTYELFKIANQEGAKRAIAYVKDSNVISLKQSMRIGWKPFLIKKVQFRFFRRYVSYSQNYPDKRYLKYSSNI